MHLGRHTDVHIALVREKVSKLEIYLRISGYRLIVIVLVCGGHSDINCTADRHPAGDPCGTNYNCCLEAIASSSY
jgi:hypothetical protein